MNVCSIYTYLNNMEKSKVRHCILRIFLKCNSKIYYDAICSHTHIHIYIIYIYIYIYTYNQKVFEISIRDLKTNYVEDNVL